MKNIIEIAHRIDDYVCMWNSVEDIYIRDTGETLPPKFFFLLLLDLITKFVNIRLLKKLSQKLNQRLMPVIRV